MSKSFIYDQICQFYMWILSHINYQYNEEDLSRSAIIFSPHFDDETLGCGGTILRKKRAGADIKLVFMTDGSKSHKHLISEEKLKRIRTKEAIDACSKLGLDSSDILFLKFKDTKLSEHINSATEIVKEILLRQTPDEIFVPYYKEPLLWSEDHLATNKIVVNAYKILGLNSVIYEYPIGFWYYYPWINVNLNSLKELVNIFKFNPVSGLFLLKDFQCSVYIRDVLELKRNALEQYKSQMTRLIPDTRWGTLPNLLNGKFLECFFQEYEIFHRYTHARAKF